MIVFTQELLPPQLPCSSEVTSLPKMAAVGCVQLRHQRQARENSALRRESVKQPRPPPVRSPCALERKLPGMCSFIKGKTSLCF